MRSEAAANLALAQVQSKRPIPQTRRREDKPQTNYIHRVVGFFMLCTIVIAVLS